MTDRAEEIEATALCLADQLLNGPDGLFEKGISIRLIGVGVSRLTEKQMQQMDLFAWAEQNEQEEKKRQAAKARQAKLNAMVDQINGRFGSGTVKKGE